MWRGIRKQEILKDLDRGLLDQSWTQSQCKEESVQDNKCSGNICIITLLRTVSPEQKFLSCIYKLISIVQYELLDID